jgi:hypothetical protein
MRNACSSITIQEFDEKRKVGIPTLTLTYILFPCFTEGVSVTIFIIHLLCGIELSNTASLSPAIPYIPEQGHVVLHQRHFWRRFICPRNASHYKMSLIQDCSDNKIQLTCA